MAQPRPDRAPAASRPRCAPTPPTTVIDYPQMGAIVSHKLGPRTGLPPYVAIPDVAADIGGTGYLSGKYGAFGLGGSPDRAGKFAVQDMVLPGTLTEKNFQRRQSIRKIVEQQIRALEADLVTLDAMDDFYKQAYTLISSPEARLRSRSTRNRKRRRNCMESASTSGPRPRSLVESCCSLGGWLKRACGLSRWTTALTGTTTLAFRNRSSTRLPSSITASLDHQRSRSTGFARQHMVWVTSEFGRTPKINKDSGRDHHARCYSMVIAGGGFSRGQMYGPSMPPAAEPARNPLLLEDLLFTIYHQIGHRRGQGVARVRHPADRDHQRGQARQRAAPLMPAYRGASNV